MDWETLLVIGIIGITVFLGYCERNPTWQRALPTVQPRPFVSIKDVKSQRVKLTDPPRRLGSLPFFDRDSPALKEAWEKRATGLIEELLRAGDAKNRESWAAAGSAYNQAAAAVALAQECLDQTLVRAEPLLARYGIDYRSLDVPRQRVLIGDAKILAVQRHWSQKLDYAGGAGQVLGRAAVGGGSWQAALVAVVVAGVMTAINDSKLLRQLRDLEGEIATMGEAMRRDANQICTSIETRLLPQYDWIVQIIDQINDRHAAVLIAEEKGGDTSLGPEEALRLGFSVAEGKMLLSKTAGD